MKIIKFIAYLPFSIVSIILFLMVLPFGFFSILIFDIIPNYRFIKSCGKGKKILGYNENGLVLNIGNKCQKNILWSLVHAVAYEEYKMFSYIIIGIENSKEFSKFFNRDYIFDRENEQLIALFKIQNINIENLEDYYNSKNKKKMRIFITDISIPPQKRKIKING